MLKYKNEWPLLLLACKANRLSVEESILLFALREVEAGRPRNEFNKPNVQNTSLAVQADSMAAQICKGEFIYQGYLKGQFPGLPLAPKEVPTDFITFLGQHLMNMEGSRKDSKWIASVKATVAEITKEFVHKDETQK